MKKIKANRKQATKFLVSTYDNSSITRKFHFLVVQNGIVVVQNNGRAEKVCCACKLVFLLFRFIEFFVVLIAVAVYHNTIFFIYKYINESFAFSPG